MTQCSWCGKEAGEFVGLKPCALCKEEMAKGVAIVVTSEDDPAFKGFFEVKDTFTHIGKYLEEWFVVSKKDFKNIIKKNSEMKKEDIKNLAEKGMFWFQRSSENDLSGSFPDKMKICNLKNV